MTGKPHIIYIGIGNAGFGHAYRKIPETPMVNTIVTLGNGKKGLAVPSLHPHHLNITSVKLHGPGIKGGVDANALHQKGIGFRIEVITPENRNMIGGNNRSFIPVKNPVIVLFYPFVLFADQLFMFL